MADTIRVNERIIGGGIIRDTTTGKSQTANYGQGALPSRTLAFTNGTADQQVNLWYLAQRTLAATTTDSLDLAGGLTGYGGATLTFTKIKRVYVSIVSPDGTKSLRVGPQGVANAAQLGWGGTGATVYNTVITDLDLVHSYAGWSVTAGTGDILPIYNPGASAVTYAIFILGLS